MEALAHGAEYRKLCVVHYHRIVLVGFPSPSSPDVGYLQFTDEVLWEELCSIRLTPGGV